VSGKIKKLKNVVAKKEFFFSKCNEGKKNWTQLEGF
jgi:hypothetical protein